MSVIVTRANMMLPAATYLEAFAVYAQRDIWMTYAKQVSCGW